MRTLAAVLTTLAILAIFPIGLLFGIALCACQVTYDSVTDLVKVIRETWEVA